MRNTLPLLSRPISPSTATATPPQPPVPTIRLISATPSATGMSSDGSTSRANISVDASWASVGPVPSPLSPRVTDVPSRKRLVPKKSKLGLLGVGKEKDKDKERTRDFSDLVRRVGGDGSASASLKGGFEIYVDPTEDPDFGEIVVVKKKKSRAGLDGMRWGSGSGGALGEITNVPSVSREVREKEVKDSMLLKVKADEKDKWWSIGRGRKDSKEKEKTKEKEKEDAKSRVREKSKTRAKSPGPLIISNPIPIEEPQSRTRFNSFDSRIILNPHPQAAPPPTGYGTVSSAQMLRTLETQPRAESPSPVTYTRSGTPTAGGLLAPPTNRPDGNQGSIAIRAMRSVRSLARIGSWAQLRNEEGMPPTKPEPKEKPKVEKPKDSVREKSGVKKKGAEKEKAPEDGKKKKKKRETKEKEKEKAQTVRASTSSFEVGALTASPEARRTETQTQTLGKKKLSILGMGLPSSMRMRSGSTASSMVLGTSHPPVSGANNRLSVESTTILGIGRAGSTISTASSLRPISTASSGSRASSASGGSTASVKWDEECLETVKETRRKERAARREEARADLEGQGKNGVKESRRTSEGRRRTPLSEVFPDAQQMQTNSASPIRPTEYPLLTVEEATSDGHGDPDASLATPLKKARPRPMSEQLLGKSRPKGMYEEDGEGVISILDAATNDLALLINRLDLEATPGTPDISPFRPSPLSNDKLPSSSAAQSGNITKKKTLPPAESPVKKGLRASTTSISSLRPYAESRKSVSSATATAIENVIGQQIASWSKLNSGLSPVKDVSPRPPPKTTSTTLTPPKFRLKHKPSMTPSPAADPSPVFQPLRPAKSRTAIATLRYSGSPASSGSPDDYGTVRAPSSLTFGGSRSSSRSGSAGSLDDMNGSPVFKKARGHTRKRSSLVPVDLQNTYSNSHRDNESTSMPIPPEAKRVLGLSGTMGGSSGYNHQEVDADDPDSDIPDELQVILSGNSDEGSIRSVDDTLSYRPDSPLPSPGLPPMLPLPVSPPAAPVLELPVFRAQLIDEEANHADIDEGGSSSEDDTKKSFDFTGELKKLNESGASDRRSFVEQLENAFRTPAKIDLHHGFDGLLSDGLLHVDIPPVPKLPTSLRTYIGDGSQSSTDVEPVSSFSDAQDPIILHFDHSENGSGSSSGFESYSASQIIHAKEPTLLPGSDSLASIENYRDQVLMEIDSPRASRSMSSMGSRPSDGKLNKDFKFGGKPPAQSPVSDFDISKPLTLSDIIPPPSHCRSLSMSSMMEEDDSVLDSIFAKASDIPPRVRLDSDSSSKRQARNFARISANLHARAHSRQSSGLSFAGFESFEEVRRGFEFGNGRPAFYPPVGAAPRVSHAKHESLFSIASVSSYGRVIDSGSIDPFDYGLPSLQERPSSENLSMSMSMSVDDTFSFLDRAPRRRRVDSDASSFYFHAPLPTTIRPYSRGHRRHESNMSVVSQAPPISLYNRSMGTHRRNDSNSSGSSVAHSYAMFGANGGRAAWARHRQDASVDSVMSDFSAMRLGRPGIGDKMFDTSENQGFPLSSISASPPESSREERSPNRPSFDSILDEERRSSVEDSLFDQTGRLSSTSSDSVFGYDYSRPPQSHLLPPNHFRPLSSLSDNSIHSPMKEDDTMISMLGGGHVRRRSVGSMIEASPCVRIEKRKHTTFRGANKYEEPYQDSPNKARIIEKPSIASTSSYKFGGERMIKAQRGLLQRQSLEDSCLIADGEDLLSTSIRPVPVFSRPGPPARSRSSTCTSSSSGGETPPLSSSDGSSISGGSQSSIDLSHLNMILSNATHPVTATHNSRAMARARARGHGHRRRFSHARASRSSVYETIQEEMSVSSSGSSDSNSPSPARTGSSSSRKNTPTVRQAVFIVEPEEPSYGSPSANSIWDDERGIVALRKYYALRDEANTAVDESHRKWADTAFSIFALQSFQPPRQPAAMQALLEQSVQTYGPLPSELRPRRMRSRTQSRPSPYPDPRRIKVKQDLQQLTSEASPIPTPTPPLATVLQPVVQKHNHNIMSPAPSLDVLKPFSPLVVEVEPKRESVGVFGAARPRVGSNARRTNLGWSKRSTGAKSSTEGKENIGYGSLATPGESLRINRPRPRGRPTPARPAPGSTTQKPIRV